VLALTIFMLVSCGSGTDAARKDVRDTPAAERIGKVKDDRIKEGSGVVMSRQYPGVFWTHNDHGHAPFIYAMTREGKSIAEFRLPFEDPDSDWEDITIDDEGHLYIADIGNNEYTRKQIQVIRIIEPDPKGKERKHHQLRTREIQTWRLTYPEQPFDAESLVLHKGYGYIISKVHHNRHATMYRFPLAEQTKPAVLEKFIDLPIYTPVTAASLTRDGKYLAVLSWGSLHVFHVNGNLANAANVEAVRIPLDRLQFEGCTFTDDGILITAESREIYFIPASAYQ
jgi:hypothetical protein